MFACADIEGAAAAFGSFAHLHEIAAAGVWLRTRTVILNGEGQSIRLDGQVDLSAVSAGVPGDGG